MKRVGGWLTRGIFAGALLLGGPPLEDSSPSPLTHALELVRAQDFQPLFELAGRRIRESFDPRKQEQFLDEAFGVSGKWKAVTRGRESYERYIHRLFEDRIFGPRDFDRLLGQIRSDYEYQTAASENRLLVELYEDIRTVRPDLSYDAFRGQYQTLAAALAPCVVRDLGMNLISFAGSDAAAVLLVAALSSAGILGTSVAGGTAAGPMTMGISIAVGVVAGLVLDAVLGEAFEDAARMEVRATVSELRNRIEDGVHAALVKALLAYRALQERCVVELYTGGSHGLMAARP